MNTILSYMARRLLGVVAKLLDKREQVRRRNLRAHPEGRRGDQ